MTPTTTPAACRSRRQVRTSCVAATSSSTHATQRLASCTLRNVSVAHVVLTATSPVSSPSGSIIHVGRSGYVGSTARRSSTSTSGSAHSTSSTPDPAAPSPNGGPTCPGTGGAGSRTISPSVARASTSASVRNHAAAVRCRAYSTGMPPASSRGRDG